MKRLVSLLAVGALAAGALGCRPTPYARGFSRAVAETMVIEGAAESAREAARRRSGGNYSGMGGGSVSPQPVPRRIPKWSMDYPKSYLRTQEGLVLRGYVNSQGYFIVALYTNPHLKPNVKEREGLFRVYIAKDGRDITGDVVELRENSEEQIVILKNQRAGLIR